MNSGILHAFIVEQVVAQTIIFLNLLHKAVNSANLLGEKTRAIERLSVHQLLTELVEEIVLGLFLSLCEDTLVNIAVIIGDESVGR